MCLRTARRSSNENLRPLDERSSGNASMISATTAEGFRRLARAVSIRRSYSCRIEVRTKVEMRTPSARSARALLASSASNRTLTSGISVSVNTKRLYVKERLGYQLANLAFASGEAKPTAR
jgi:hypothetical protein